MVFTVEAPPYGKWVLVCIDEKEENIRKRLIKWGIPDAHLDRGKLRPYTQGRAVMFPAGQALIILPKKPSTPLEHGTLAHEIFHIVDFIMERIGMTLTESSGEAYAYLVGHITSQIYLKMRQTKKV